MDPGGARAPVQVRTLEVREATDRAAERFLVRVAALDAEAWGRLDAAGQRFNANDPLSRWERARRMSAMFGALPLLEAALTPVDFATEALRDLVRWLNDRPAEPWGMRRPHDGPPMRASPASAFYRRLQELWDTAAARPGGPGPAISPLTLALLALQGRSSLPAESFARMYELVEPVIPVAEL